MMSERLYDPAWRWLLRHAILPAGDLAFGQGMMAHLRFLEKAQWWDRERLYAERDARLQSLMKTAFHEVPFYRELMERARVTWRDFRSPADLAKLPIVAKEVLRAGYPDRVTRRTGRSTYEAGSSGSTGANFYVREDAPTAGRYRAAFLLALAWAGWRIGDPHAQTGMTLERSRDRRLKDRLLRCHYVSAFDLADARLDATLNLIERRRISHLWGYPGSLYFLAARALHRGWNRPLRSLVTWGDNLYPHYRKTIEAAFRTRVFDTYGCGEGIQIAAQCGHASNYHIFTTETVVEFVEGGLIVTRLWPGPMPLIRYRIGDLGVAGPTQPCPCGRGFDLLGGIEGRDTDVVVTPAGNRLIVHFFTGILEHFREIACFQVVQSEPGSILLRLAPAGGCVVTPELEAEIVRRFDARGMQGMKVHFEITEEIPVAASGKRRFVISKLAPRPAAEAILP